MARLGECRWRKICESNFLFFVGCTFAMDRKRSCDRGESSDSIHIEDHIRCIELCSWGETHGSEPHVAVALQVRDHHHHGRQPVDRNVVQDGLAAAMGDQRDAAARSYHHAPQDHPPVSESNQAAAPVGA